MAARAACALLVVCGSLRPDVVVISNRTGDTLQFEIVDGSQASGRAYTLTPMQSTIIDVAGKASLRGPEQGTEPFTLDRNGVYFFADSGGGPALERIGFSTQPVTAEADPAATSIPEFSVRLFIDDQLVRRSGSKDRVLRRFRKVAKFFEAVGIARLKVPDEVESWESVDAARDLSSAQFDFEKSVPLEPGEIAIGFSGQVREARRMPLDCAPLRRHIVVPESRLLRTTGDRLQMLAHAVGHYFGAVHSPERGSVMSTKFDYRLAGPTGLSLDPPNVLVAGIVARNLQGRPLTNLSELSPPARGAIRPVFVDLAQAMTDDAVAAANLAELDGKRKSGDLLPATALSEPARTVLTAVVRAASDVSRQRSAARKGTAERPATGDALAELYVRAAAQAATTLPAETRAKAFALGLAVALDKSGSLRTNPLTAHVWKSIETDREYYYRRAILGQPTMRGRYDITQHFSISAGLVAAFGSKAAVAAGVLKEQTDSHFSRADFSADLAGVTFMEHLQGDPRRLESLATGFLVTDFLPACEEAAAPKNQPAPRVDPVAMREELLREIGALPAYRR